ncbi:MAG: DUF5916 domain-containing protein [Saprospiraceae bacterium]
MKSRIFLSALLCLWGVGAWAQTERPNQASHQLEIRRTLNEVRLDGVLDEPDWQQTPVATDFWEKDPRDGILAERQTEARVMYDDQFLYVGIICYDDSTRHVIQNLKRDVDYFDGDAVAILLDPMNEASNGFMFGVNPEGVQMEALLAGSSGDGNYNENWDNIWFAEATVSPDRWIVEMAIPFTTLRFNPTAKTWGLNFLRNDIKHNQFHVWAPVPRQFWGIDLGYAGQLLWDNPPPGAGSNISLIPYINGAASQTFEEGKANASQSNFDAGIDAKIAITSSLNLDLTVNPDFSQVDVDVQQTNLTRFDLFFPERRNFFLENSDLFANFGIPPVRPFFSRRIGLSEDGSPIPVRYGARLTGNLNENLRIGIMDVQTAGATQTDPGQNYLTVAATHRIWDRSSLRAMFINRQELGGEGADNKNYTRNLDLEFNYQSADGTWQGWSTYHHSFRHGITDEQGYWNTGFAYTKPNFNGLVDIVTVQDNYFADVGFVNRVENYDAERDTVIRKGYHIVFVPLNLTLLPKVDWLQNLNFYWKMLFSSIATRA